jgi:hypothetical protein
MSGYARENQIGTKMNKVLKDPIAVKKRQEGEFPWGQKAPTKDHATSGCLSVGEDYGIGHRQPTGKETASNLSSGPIPQESRCFSTKEIFYGEDKKG